jgi:hypothetical protein
VSPDTDTYDALCEVMDEVQRGNQMLARLCEKTAIDPAEAARLPGDSKWTVVLNDKAELYEVLLEPRPDGSLRVFRHRVFKADGAEYGDMLDMAPPPRATSQRENTEAA